MRVSGKVRVKVRARGRGRGRGAGEGVGVGPKKLRTAASEAPMYLFSNSGPLTVTMGRRDSAASAAASSVLPQPDGP